MSMARANCSGGWSAKRPENLPTPYMSQSYRMAAARAVLAYAADPSQELGIELVQRRFDNVTDELGTQADGVRKTTRELMDQQRRQQTTMQTLARKSVEAYMNLIKSMFSLYGGAKAGGDAGGEKV